MSDARFEAIQADAENLKAINPELFRESEALAEQAAAIQRTMTEEPHRQFVRNVIAYCERVRMIADQQKTSIQMVLDQLPE